MVKNLAGYNHTSWKLGELTSTGTLGILPSIVELDQTLYFEHHGGIWLQSLFTFEALDLTEWRELLEGTDQELVPRAPES